MKVNILLDLWLKPTGIDVLKSDDFSYICSNYGYWKSNSTFIFQYRFWLYRERQKKSGRRSGDHQQLLLLLLLLRAGSTRARPASCSCCSLPAMAPHTTASCSPSPHSSVKSFCGGAQRRSARRKEKTTKKKGKDTHTHPHSHTHTDPDTHTRHTHRNKRKEEKEQERKDTKLSSPPLTA